MNEGTEIAIRVDETISSFRRDDPFFAYDPAVGRIDGKLAIAYIRNENGKDTLRLKGGKGDKAIFAGAYIYSPVITSEQIVFSARTGNGEWGLFSATPSGADGHRTERIDSLPGRVQSIRGETRLGGSYICYERREGVHTRIYAAFPSESGWACDIPVTDGSYNAYDPHIAFSEDGYAYAIYTAFRSGNYCIMLQKLKPSGDKAGEAVQVSDLADICYYPSVAPRSGGGVWICWTGFTGLNLYENTYLQYPKYRLLRGAFYNYPALYAGCYFDDTLFMPLTDPDAKKFGHIDAFRVENAACAKCPVIWETENGSPALLHQYYPEDKRIYSYPDIAISVLTGSGWSKPATVSAGHPHSAPISCLPEGSGMHIAYMKDERHTGWGFDGELFDAQGAVELKYGLLSLPCVQPFRLDLEAYPAGHHPAHSIADADYRPLEPGGKRIVWGQTHKHTDISYCLRMHDQSIDFNYRFYQDVFKSEFGTVTDHTYNMWSMERFLFHKASDFYYFPGEFIAYPAYEWVGSGTNDGGPFGHVNPILLEEDGKLDVYEPIEPEGKGISLHKLWSEYSGRSIITIPHHTADAMHTYNWEFYDEDMTPVAEVFQNCRGQQEQPRVYGSTAYRKVGGLENGWVISALKRGYRLGLIGGGDHLGIARAGVEVDELTRKGLYKALMQRRAYATTGAGADMRFSCNGAPLGSRIVAENAEFIFEISANEKIREVCIVRNGDDKKRLTGRGKKFSYRWEAKREADVEFWYCRALLDNGEAFWTSPIWLVSP